MPLANCFTHHRGEHTWRTSDASADCTGRLCFEHDYALGHFEDAISRAYRLDDLRQLRSKNIGMTAF